MRPPLTKLIDDLVKERGGEPGHEDTEPRGHLGASIVGDPCSRNLWYSFRWALPNQFPGRMLRLFATGFKYEKRFIDLLEMVGADVQEYNPDSGERLWYHGESDSYIAAPHTENYYEGHNGGPPLDDVDGIEWQRLRAATMGVVPAKKKQYRLSAVDGHFGGSCDGIATGIPFIDALGLGFGPLTRVLCEFKTHNAKSFAKLDASGVRISKPKHYAQMCIYMEKMGIPVGLYCAANKDTDDLHFEFVLPNQPHALQHLRKAEIIITSQFPPPRIGSATSFTCKYCDHIEVCHRGEALQKNCRTCLHSAPVANGEWSCRMWDGKSIPFAFQQKGCDKHSYIPEG